ncbi:MAG: hypothetical protein DHS20C15_07770 [Planctomycetota bacterium]|nr:MAG: hypothetical protein DHS20C15_07770 [Planctomycetota bacterium]
MRTTRVWIVGLCLALAGSAPAYAALGDGDSDRRELVPWSDALADVAVHRGSRKKTLQAVSDDLSAGQVAAMGQWVAFAERYELHVVLPEKADALIFGDADLSDLKDVADTLDESWALFDALQPVEPRDDDDARTPVFFLFDREAHASPTWPALLELMATRGQLVSQAVDALRVEPTSLTQRNERLVLQATYDMAGDASKGDDEFRLENEVAHKLVWMLLLERFGRLPPNVEWGLGYVAEQRLFRSIFLFDTTGFVAVEDHHDWPDRTRDMFVSERTGQGVDLPKRLLDAAAAGGPLRPQMQSWGLLDYLLHKDAERLVALLTELSELHGAGDPYGIQPRYAGDPEVAASLIGERLEGISVKDIEKHLKRVK